jgi:multicomponent Na+:H+ antiporter subunit D
MAWAGWVLTASSLLNAAYLLPILYRAWFKRQPHTWPHEHIPARRLRETTWLLLIPPLVTAAATLVAGVFYNIDWSPLFWAKLIAEREYLP